MANITTTKIYNFFYVLRQGTRAFLADILSIIIFRVYLAVNLFIVSSIWLIAYIINLKTSSEDFISLNYSVDFGVNLIGPADLAYTLPLIGTLILAVNVIIIGLTYKQDKFTSHVLFVSSVMANLVLLIAVILIYFINFR